MSRFIVIVLCGALALARSAQAQAMRSSKCSHSESVEDCFKRGLKLAQQSVEGEKGNAEHTHAAHALEAKALSILRSACAGGHGEACYFAGRMIAAPQEWPLDRTATGTGAADSAITASLTEAAKLFRRGCYAEPRPSAAACNALGDAHTYGLGEKIQLDSAIKFYEKSCNLGGAAAACTRWSFLLESHKELGPERRILAYELVQKGCSAGSPTGCANVAYVKDTALTHLANAEVEKLENQAQGQIVARLYREQCKNGVEIACNNVGALFASGRYGIPRGLSPEQRRDSSIYYYKLACNGIPLRVERGDTTKSLGVGYGCLNLGNRALSSTPPDTAGAIVQYRKGCLLFERNACAELALQEYLVHHDSAVVSLLRAVTACNEGLGLGCNYAGWLLREPAFEDRKAESLDYFRRACALEYAWSCKRLGDLESTIGKRAKYYRRACELNEGWGCRGLGSILQQSFSQEDRALIYYGKACDDGVASGCWDAKQLYRERHDELNEGLYRAKACRTDPNAYCKKKDSAS